MFDAAKLERFWCSTLKSYPKLSTKALTILVPFATIKYLCESTLFSLLHLKTNYQNQGWKYAFF